MRRRPSSWHAFILLSLAACGGGVAGNDSTDAGPGSGADATTSCSQLASCCATLTGAPQSLCSAVVSLGNGTDCATELGQLESEGDCSNVGLGGDGGNAGDTSLHDGPAAGDDGGPGPGSDAPPPPPAACSSISCTPPQVCVAPPGVSATCGTACQSAGDCPSWLTCQGGICAQCTQSSCAAGQQCSWVTSPRPGNCSANTDCSLGSYCDQGMCQPIMVCSECLGGCTTCVANWQCNAGQVCISNACVTCTSNAQCGPSAVCGATHTGMQCTCTMDSDCSTNETCQSGICAQGGVPTGDGGGTGCDTGIVGCPTGQACVNNACGPCSTFEDCNTQPNGDPRPPPGLACIAGVCTSCTANSQCGGGMACVGATCGTCSTNSQCGPSGQCSDGYCTCTGDAQCASGQRCGSGVCVAM